MYPALLDKVLYAFSLKKRESNEYLNRSRVFQSFEQRGTTRSLSELGSETR